MENHISDDKDHDSRSLRESIEKLIAIQERSISIKMNFFRGIFYGIGAFLGSVLFAAILVWLLSKIDTVPLIGEFISRILDEIGEDR